MVILTLVSLMETSMVMKIKGNKTVISMVTKIPDSKMVMQTETGTMGTITVMEMVQETKEI